MINETFGNLKVRSTRYGNHNLVEYLKIDLFNSKAEDFTNSLYKVTQHKDDIFLFLDNNGDIIGVLRGKKWDKDFSHINMKTPYGTKKTWDEFSELSTKILRVPKHELKYKKRYNKKYSQKNTLKDYEYKHSLKERLNEYKKNKYESLNWDDLRIKSINITNNTTQLLFLDTLKLDDKKDIDSELGKIFSLYLNDSPSIILSKLSEKMSSLWNFKNRILEKQDELTNAEIYRNNFESKEEYADYKTYVRRDIERTTEEYECKLNETKVFIVELERLTNKLEKMFLK